MYILRESKNNLYLMEDVQFLIFKGKDMENRKHFKYILCDDDLLTFIDLFGKDYNIKIYDKSKIFILNSPFFKLSELLTQVSLFQPDFFLVYKEVFAYENAAINDNVPVMCELLKEYKSLDADIISVKALNKMILDINPDTKFLII